MNKIREEASDDLYVLGKVGTWGACHPCSTPSDHWQAEILAAAEPKCLSRAQPRSVGGTAGLGLFPPHHLCSQRHSFSQPDADKSVAKAKSIQDWAETLGAREKSFRSRL